MTPNTMAAPKCVQAVTGRLCRDCADVSGQGAKRSACLLAGVGELPCSVIGTMRQRARPSAFALTQRVRCFFGTEYRDGRIEFIAEDGTLMVRLTPGWLHSAAPDDVQSLEFVPTTAWGAL